MTDFYDVRDLPRGVQFRRRESAADYWRSLHLQFAAEDPGSKAVFANWDICVARFGAIVFTLERGGKLLSANATYFGKRPKGDWGRYINNYIGYTPLAFRRQGWANRLQRIVECTGRNEGMDRGKALVQSYLGFRHHLALGHWFWGQNGRGELVVDYPLRPDSKLPSGKPPNMEPQNCQPQPPRRMSVRAVREALLGAPFNMSPKDIDAAFFARPLEYR